MPTDSELLASYLERRDERAFGELVQRHLRLVYSAALRRSGGRNHLAEEISQKVFCDLARKASSLVRHPALTGWLYQTTRYLAIDAARAELHREKLAQSLAAMSDLTASPETPADWEKLRPVLDESMDQLKPRDREMVLLRYFEGLSFAEVGARFGLRENAARMRAERALDQLRAHLDKRGVTSTSAALGLVLATPAFAAAPSGLAATVTVSALAGASASGATGLVSVFLMSKLAAPALSAALAAGLTALVWISAHPFVSAKELTALRQENARLSQATAAGASTASIAAVAGEFTAQAAAIVQAMSERHTKQVSVSSAPSGSPAASARSAVTARGHSYHGQATAHDAMLTFAWACDLSDPDEMARLVYFESSAREKALTVLATMPESIRVRYPTPERLYGLFLAAMTLEAPPPGADVMERRLVEVELSPGRVATRRIGSSVNEHEYQQTAEGWKYVYPERGIDAGPRILNSETLAKLIKR